MKLIVAFLTAAILPASLITGWYLYGQLVTFEPNDLYIWVRTGHFFSLCIVVSAAYVFLLGVPTYYVLLKFKAIRWWSTVIAGFILGAIPMAFFSWPLKYPDLKTSASVDGVQTMINGVPTVAGWLQFIYGVTFLGVCGVVGALAFWLVAPNNYKQGDCRTLRVRQPLL